MTVLITGATGLVGSRLLRRLVDAGVECRATVRRSVDLPPGVTGIEADLLNARSLPGAVEGVSAVIHLAASLRGDDPAQIQRVNVSGTRNLISAVHRHAPGARVIMTSTGLVYDDDVPRPARESDPTSPRSPYPASKVAAERALRASGLTWCILRLAFVYGDGDGHLRSAPRLLRSRNAHPAQTMSLLHHRDVAGIVQSALCGNMDGRVVNVADDAPTSIHEVARVVGDEYSESAEPLTNPWQGRMDCSLARELGFTPVIRSIYQAHHEGAL